MGHIFLGIAAVGMTFVIISVGAVIGFTGVRSNRDRDAMALSLV